MVEVRGRAVGGEAVYRCNPGFVLRGSTTRICVEDGQWTGEQPVCEGKIYMGGIHPCTYLPTSHIEM